MLHNAFAENLFSLLNLHLNNFNEKRRYFVIISVIAIMIPGRTEYRSELFVLVKLCDKSSYNREWDITKVSNGFCLENSKFIV